MPISEVIDEVGRRLSALTPPDTRIVLFGSHARAEAGDQSDLDLLVIEPEVENAIEEAVRLRRGLRGLGVPIDVLVVDQAHAQRRAAVPGTVISRALREGRVLART